MKLNKVFFTTFYHDGQLVLHLCRQVTIGVNCQCWDPGGPLPGREQGCLCHFQSVDD